MEILNDLKTQKRNNLSLILGFFDGLHKGHREVIRAGVQFAKNNGLKSALITFRDAPAVFLKNKEPQYILTTKEKIKNDLEKHIFGIELDAIECQKCKDNLTKMAEKFNINNVCWNILCCNTLTVKQYDGKMDYVVGNPPYVRIHNLDNLDEVKRFQFSKKGMTDLYITFFEILN